MSCYLTQSFKKQVNKSINKFDDDFSKKKIEKYKRNKLYRRQIIQESMIGKYYSEIPGKLMMRDDYE